MSARFRAGVRAGAPFGIAGCLLAASFGVLARDVGMPGWAAVLMSVIVFAGSAQIAALTIIGAGGGLGAAIGAAALMNSRFLPMGIAIGPSLPGGPVARAAQGQTVVDASWALASDGEGGFDRQVLFGSSAVQYVGWVTGTVVGVIGGAALGDPKTFGLDAIYPAFFTALLIQEIRGGRGLGVAAAGALIALVLIPVAPAGVPVLVASLASLLGLRHRRRPAEPA
jgi:predicted branched-subunit amino acid permease